MAIKLSKQNPLSRLKQKLSGKRSSKGRDNKVMTANKKYSK